MRTNPSNARRPAGTAPVTAAGQTTAPALVATGPAADPPRIPASEPLPVPAAERLPVPAPKRPPVAAADASPVPATERPPVPAADSSSGPAAERPSVPTTVLSPGPAKRRRPLDRRTPYTGAVSIGHPSPHVPAAQRDESRGVARPVAWAGAVIAPTAVYEPPRPPWGSAPRSRRRRRRD